jgi:hypothetical protein
MIVMKMSDIKVVEVGIKWLAEAKKKKKQQSATSSRFMPVTFQALRAKLF